MINGSGQTATQSTRFNNFTNDTIVPCTSGCSSNYYDIVLTANVTDIIFTNVSFNKSRISIVPRNPSNPIEKNNLTVKWFLDVNVTNSTDNKPIVGAEVNINDSFATNVFSGLTDATGGIATQTVTEFTINGSSFNSTKFFTSDTCIGIDNLNVTCFTPYNISVNFTGYDRDDTSVIVNRSKFVNISLSISGVAAAPVIKLNNVSTFTVNPKAGDSVEVLISFNVTDAQGVDTINASKAIVNFTLGPPDVAQFRYNISDQGGVFGTCGNHTEGTTVVINCTVLMRYYDDASSAWVINVSVEDTSGKVGRNDTLTFTYNSLAAFTLTRKGLSESGLNFSSLNLGNVDKPGKAPILLNNTGNSDFDQINITAADLVSGSNFIGVGNFTINITNNIAGNGMHLSKSPQTIPELGAAPNSNATLLHGPGISGDSVPYPAVADFKTKGNLSLFFWVDIPYGLATGTYNNTWNLTLVDID